MTRTIKIEDLHGAWQLYEPLHVQQPRKLAMLLAGRITRGKEIRSYPQREFVELRKRIPQEAALISQPTVPADFMQKLSTETGQASDGTPPRVEAVFSELSKEVTASLVSR